jgi:hypothetical protein
MPVAKRLQTMEALWDSLGAERPALPSPSWHRDVLAERSRKLRSGKAKLLDLDQVRDRLAR